MKKITITLFGLFFLFNSINAQSYKKFPEGNFVWNYWLSYYGGMPCDGSNNQFVKLYFGNDTTINSTAYHRLYTSSIYYPFVGCGPPWYSSGVFADHIRQDTVLRKVYRLNPLTQTDTVLLDFDLIIGQIHPATQLVPPNTIFVSSIDSVLLGDNKYHKVFNFKNIDTAEFFLYCDDTTAIEYVSLIEGVGFTRGFPYSSEYGGIQFGGGMMVSPECQGWNAPSPILACYGTAIQLYGNVSSTWDNFSHTDSVFYDSTAALCNVTLAIEDIDAESNISIYPNPTVDNLYLELAQYESPLNYRIFDIHGKTILVSNLLHNDSKINVSMLQAGLYFLQIETSPTIIKFIKQ